MERNIYRCGATMISFTTITSIDCLIQLYSFNSMTKDNGKDNGRHSDEEVWLFGIGEKAISCISDSCSKCSLLQWELFVY